MLDSLGSPQAAYPSVLIAGTNGKGSTAALLTSILRAADVREAMYSSPHLHELEERIRVGGRQVPAGTLAELIGEVLAAAGAELPTYFEALTAAALLHFARARVDLAVLEVGLGGRLDATNAVEPVLSLVTSIGSDHGEHLGRELAEIAREKAGIFRRGATALVRVEDATAAAALEAEAARIGARLLRVEERVQVRAAGSDDQGGQRVVVKTPLRELEAVLPLRGSHQLGNLALAVAAAELLEVTGRLVLRDEAVRRGIEGCSWAGRLERLELPGGRTVLLDGAHNPPAVRALAAYLEESGARVDLLFGVLADKRVEEMLPHLLPYTERIVLALPPGSRAADPETYRHLAAARPVKVERHLPAAVTAALDGSAPAVLVTGSIYLVGAVRGLLLKAPLESQENGS